VHPRVSADNGRDLGGVEVATPTHVPDPNVLNQERRTTSNGDRRRNSRSGRRTGDPRVSWRRLAWLFAAYALYVSVRSLPATLKGMFQRSPAR
jgi:hypothetical protein